MRQSKFNTITSIIASPAAMRTATMNAIVAANEVIVGGDCGFYALYGLTELMRQIARVSDAYEKDDLVIRGLLTSSNRGQNLDRDVKAEVSDFFGGLMIQSILHKNVRLAEAASASQPIIELIRARRGHLISETQQGVAVGI
jgi:chromosome partitioning protein